MTCQRRIKFASAGHSKKCTTGGFWRIAYGRSWRLCTSGQSRLTFSGLLVPEPTSVIHVDEDLKAELERLRSENAALKKGAPSGIRMKVSEKGAVSIYGMGRFPITLYKEQWLRLLDISDEIRAFIATNEAQLKAKD